MPEARSPDPRTARAIERVRERVDAALERFLLDRRAEIAAMDPAAAVLVEELERVMRAGGKRIRPALCYGAYRAAGGADGEPIVRACAALELLHTSALIHDDVMDREVDRRGAPSTHVRFTKEAPPGADPDAFGTSAAIVAGDLALVLSEQLLRSSGFPPDRIARAWRRFDRMRAEMAAGQFLDVAGASDLDRVSSLKSGSYTADGPVSLGAALADADPVAEGQLRLYGRLVGEAFQLRDDVVDGDAPAEAAARVDELLGRARRALHGSSLEPEGTEVLDRLADLLRLRRGNG